MSGMASPSGLRLEGLSSRSLNVLSGRRVGGGVSGEQHRRTRRRRCSGCTVGWNPMATSGVPSLSRSPGTTTAHLHPSRTRPDGARASGDGNPGRGGQEDRSATVAGQAGQPEDQVSVAIAGGGVVTSSTRLGRCFALDASRSTETAVRHPRRRHRSGRGSRKQEECHVREVIGRTSRSCNASRSGTSCRDPDVMDDAAQRGLRGSRSGWRRLR